MLENNRIDSRAGPPSAVSLWSAPISTGEKPGSLRLGQLLSGSGGSSAKRGAGVFPRDRLPSPTGFEMAQAW